jgi:hypothetical protein
MSRSDIEKGRPSGMDTYRVISEMLLLDSHKKP